MSEIFVCSHIFFNVKKTFRKWKWRIMKQRWPWFFTGFFVYFEEMNLSESTLSGCNEVRKKE